jgi:CheY-like chemotaxis protein
MEAIGRLAGGIAHDFNNLLSVILSYAELTIEGLDVKDPLREDILEIETAGRRATELTSQLLAFSRQQVLQPKVMDLNASLASIQRMLQRLLGEDIELRTVPERSLRAVMADRGQIEQIIMNLAVNARDAMPNGGRLTIQTSNVVLDETQARRHLGAKPGPHVMLSVSDTGTGIDKATLANIFEPFFTTKPVGKGTGLGLATVLGIVQQSGGSIDVHTEVGIGTTFNVLLPTCQACPIAAAASAGAVQLGGKGETILLVEDEEQVRHLAETILGRRQYKVLSAASPAQAIALSEQYAGEIHLLLTDLVMPGMNGRQLADRIQGARGDLQVMYMSGYTANVVIERGVVHDAELSFLQKPITPETLSRAVRKSLDAFAERKRA